jgi:hypothetical protein
MCISDSVCSRKKSLYISPLCILTQLNYIYLTRKWWTSYSCFNLFEFLTCDTQIYPESTPNREHIFHFTLPIVCVSYISFHITTLCVSVSLALTVDASGGSLLRIWLLVIFDFETKIYSQKDNTVDMWSNKRKPFYQVTGYVTISSYSVLSTYRKIVMIESWFLSCHCAVPCYSSTECDCSLHLHEVKIPYLFCQMWSYPNAYSLARQKCCTFLF